MTPKFIKFNYRNVERVWLKVEKFQINIRHKLEIVDKIQN